MEFDEMMSVLGSISEHYSATLEILSDTIGYEFTEGLLNPLFEYILPKKDTLGAESFLKVVDEIAAKLFLYSEGQSRDVYYSRLEDIVSHYETAPKEDAEA